MHHSLDRSLQAVLGGRAASVQHASKWHLCTAIAPTCCCAPWAVLCGNNGEACWAKYGAYPLHRPYCHEMALRILLASIESHANRYKRHIVPVLSLSIDFYVRVGRYAPGSSEAHVNACWHGVCTFTATVQRIHELMLPGGSLRNSSHDGSHVDARDASWLC